MNGPTIKYRTISFLIILVIYILSATAGFVVLSVFSDLPVLLSTLVADIAATIVVWVSGIVFKNSSVYDPYWSVAPIIIVLFWAGTLDISYSVTDILFFTAVIIWGIRLTANWALRWKGMKDQDWRYTMFKKRSPGMWFLTNLFGINLMPTLIVFISLTPVYFGLGSTERAAAFAIPGFVVCMAAVAVQAVSDRQMDIFRQDSSNKGKHIDRGLWRYSRHPNYLGEVSFWWGLWLMQAWISPGNWWTTAGPLLMTMLFAFVSIPMMEGHILETRPEYRKYMKEVSVLKFLPRRDSQEL